MSAQAKVFITPEEYLALEREAEHKHEYYQGVRRPLHRDSLAEDETLAMAGATRNHVLLVTNLIAALHARLREAGCFIFSSDLRVYVEAHDLYTYPDLAVACGEMMWHEQALRNPVLLVEVLSPSTEAYDRGEKFGFYRAIPSLQEYVLVSQHEKRVEVFTKTNDGMWMLRDFEDEVELSSTGARVRIDDLYDGVVLPEGPVW